MPDRPAWTQMHLAAAKVLDVLNRLSLALKARDDAEGQRIYAELPTAIDTMRQVAYPMERALRENFGAISDEEKTAGAYLARVINTAQEALAALSGFGKTGTGALNRWYADLQQLVRRSSTLAKEEVESN